MSKHVEFPGRRAGTRMARALILGAVVFGAGCFPFRDRGSELLFWRKPVVQKREPAYLIAPDRTACTVARERFRSTEIGDSVWCLWRDMALAGLTPEAVPRRGG